MSLYRCKCGASTANQSMKCDECGKLRKEKRRRKVKDPFYQLAVWKKFAVWYRRRNPLCVHCLARGRTTAANVVDHIQEIKDGGARLSEANVQSLCSRCHGIKTAAAKAEREGRVESPPTCPADPFGSVSSPPAKLRTGGIRIQGGGEKAR